MKRILVALTMAIMVAGLLSMTAPAASADSRPCVTKGEYNRAKRGMTTARVKQIFDTWGKQVGRYARWEWNERGYDRDVAAHDRNEPQEWEYDTDEWGLPTDQYYYDWEYWFDSYPDPEDYYFWAVDTVRSYKKCRSFDKGKGRVGINFDQYYHRASGMRMYKKVRNNPRLLVSNMGYARMMSPNKVK